MIVTSYIVWIPVVLSVVWWGIQVVGTILVRRGVPRLDAPEFKALYVENGTDFPPLSIVVAARNEERQVEAALREKLDSDYPNLQIVFVNDRSTDRTGEIAEALAETDERLSVIHIDELPSGWLGKVHALHRGVHEADGEWILFTDADVHLGGDLLKRAMAVALNERLDHLTALPAFLQTSKLVTLTLSGFIRALMILTQSWKTLDGRSKAFFGCGAFNLVKRSALDKTPGLSHLKMEIGDDVALGAMMKAFGARQKTVFLGGLSRLEFYPNLRALFTGLEKNGATMPWFLFPIVALLLLSLEVGYLALVMLEVTPALMVAGAVFYVVAAMTQMTMSIAWGAPRWPALLPGFGAVIFSLAFVRSGFLAAIRRGVVWRGTFYSTEAVRNGAVVSSLVKAISASIKAEAHSDGRSPNR